MNTTRFYIGQRFNTYDENRKLVGKIGVLKVTSCQIFYVDKDNINTLHIPRVSMTTANRLIFKGLWKHYLGDE